MAMVTFKQPKAEKGKAVGSNPTIAGEDTQPPPSIRLGHSHLQALGMKSLPAVGTKLHLHAIAHVGSTSEDQDRGDGGKARQSMTLHLHSMDLGDGKQSAMSDEDQKAGAKAEIDKALTKRAGSESAKAKPAGAKEGGKGG